MAKLIHYYAHRMTVNEWLLMTGEHKLAFGISRSVEVPRKKAKPQHPQRWRGGDLYNYGDMPPRHPMPVSRGAVRWQDMDLPALLAFGFENWLHDARPTWGEHVTD